MKRTTEQRREAALLGVARRQGRQEALATGRTCPECGVARRNAETLRAHRGLAHGVEA